MDIKKIVTELTLAKNEYYNNDSVSHLTDAEYDNLETQLKKIAPNHVFFKMVGSPIENGRSKYKHSTKMLSCDKAKTVDEIMKWINKYRIAGKKLVAEYKLDGLSANLEFENGKFISAATRGDGELGIDITLLMQHIQFPKTIPIKKRIHIRGEFVAYKDSKINNPNNTNLRNVVAGQINSKTIEPVQLKFIKFIGYQIIGSDFKTESEKIDYLNKIGFETVDYTIVESKEEINNYYQKYLNELRDEYKIATDGLVFCLDDSTMHEKIDKMGSSEKYHLWNISIKPLNESAESILKSIEWNPSRNGRLIPVAIFSPVVIDGATITRASLSNYGCVNRMKLSIGDKLKIVKCGGIIPRVDENLTRGIVQ